MKLEENAESWICPVDEVPADAMILDAGPQSLANLKRRLAGVRTVLWNGPLGAFETAPFGEATFAIARETPPGSLIQAPYVVAQVKLPEKVIVGSVLTDCDVDSVRCDMPVELVLEKVKEDAEGNDVVAFKFRVTQ